MMKTTLKQKDLQCLFINSILQREPQIAYVEQMVFFQYQYEMSICFTPQGNIQPPVTMNELYQALSCILKALNEVHKRGLMHRDLRWDNIAHEIGKTKDNANWFLLDFDEA